MNKLRLTADKRRIKDFSKLPLATSFIRKTLSEIAGNIKIKEVIKWRIGGNGNR